MCQHSLRDGLAEGAFMKRMLLFFGVVVMIVGMATTGAAMERKDKKAIVLANFGTTYLSALKAIITIRDEVRKSFPGVKVKVAFTSNIIRRIWHKRRTDAAFMKEHGVEFKDFLSVKGPLATIADLQDEGYRKIIVQPTHVYSGEEFADLKGYVEGLNAITTIKKKYMPFKYLLLGRPALGTSGITHDYHKDLDIAAKTLKEDVAIARGKGAALVYMGHGNEYFSTGIYAEFQQVMRRMYPGVDIYIGTVEGFPSASDVIAELRKSKPEKVVLKPLMVVAGDHASNDMAGDEDDSWKSSIERLGIKVTPILRGLGENRGWANLYADHIRDAIKDNGVEW
jgi:sirohydrochlorin cobaltochelatase